MKRRAGRGDLDGDRLQLRRGVRVVEIDNSGAVISDAFHPGASLTLNIGDAAIVAAADLTDDSIAHVSVVDVASDGAPIIAVNTGQLPSGNVHVYPARKAKPPKRSKPRRPVQSPGADVAALVRRARERLLAPQDKAPGVARSERRDDSPAHEEATWTA